MVLIVAYLVIKCHVIEKNFGCEATFSGTLRVLEKDDDVQIQDFNPNLGSISGKCNGLSKWVFNGPLHRLRFIRH